MHLGDYGLDLPEGRRLLPDLIERILDVEGVERFRLSSIEPASLGDEIITLMAGSPKFARHFHIPFQSGSDAVLARMKRRYRAGELADLVTRIADRVPDCGIGADVICGFPGETDEDFLRTFEYVEKLPITYVHAFTYSPRPGSEAEHFPGEVPGEIRKRRTRALKRLSAEKHRRFAERHVGRIVEVLIEASRRGGAARIGGWTDNYLRVDLGEGEGSARIEPVEITGLDDNGLSGACVSARRQAGTDVPAAGRRVE